MPKPANHNKYEPLFPDVARIPPDLVVTQAMDERHHHIWSEWMNKDWRPPKKPIQYRYCLVKWCGATEEREVKG